jgi:F0F1-type ATP synthase membrane subunit c/vacuolar-type H+-ATPase subunit K
VSFLRGFEKIAKRSKEDKTLGVKHIPAGIAAGVGLGGVGYGVHQTLSSVVNDHRAEQAFKKAVVADKFLGRGSKEYARHKQDARTAAKAYLKNRSGMKRGLAAYGAGAAGLLGMGYLRRNYKDKK